MPGMALAVMDFHRHSLRKAYARNHSQIDCRFSQLHLSSTEFQALSYAFTPSPYHKLFNLYVKKKLLNPVRAESDD
jgi:hypothetical protein